MKNKPLNKITFVNNKVTRLKNKLLKSSSFLYVISPNSKMIDSGYFF